MRADTGVRPYDLIAPCHQAKFLIFQRLPCENGKAGTKTWEDIPGFAGMTMHK